MNRNPMARAVRARQNERVNFPIDLQIGSIRIPSHLLFELLAFGLGFAYYQSQRRRRSDDIPGRVRMSIVIAAAFGALIGFGLCFGLAA